MTPVEIINRLLEESGGATAIAARLGSPVKRQNVEYWFQEKVRNIPEEYCPALQRAYGIPCQDLRPDLNWVLGKKSAEWPDGKPLLDHSAKVA